MTRVAIMAKQVTMAYAAFGIQGSALFSFFDQAT